MEGLKAKINHMTDDKKILTNCVQWTSHHTKFKDFQSFPCNPSARFYFFTYLLYFIHHQINNNKLMRLFQLISLLIISFSCSNTKNTSIKLSRLNGNWVPIKQEMAGQEFPKAAFVNQKLTINDTTYILSAESIDKGVVKYRDDKMDIYGKEGVNAGKHFTALYKYENGELTICYNLAGNNYPQTFETKGKPTYFLSVFKKE